MAQALPYIAMAMQAYSMVQSSNAASQQAAAQSQALQYQAAVAQNNQILAEQYAQRSIQVGQVQEDKVRMANAERQGSIRAAAGASGIDVNSGSPLRVQEDSAKLGEQDALTVRNNAEQTAQGYRVQGLSYAAQGQLDASGAGNALAGGAMASSGAIISGTASVADKWMNYKRSGVFSGDSSTLSASSDIPMQPGGGY